MEKGGVRVERVELERELERLGRIGKVEKVEEGEDLKSGIIKLCFLCEFHSCVCVFSRCRAIDRILNE